MKHIVTGDRVNASAVVLPEGVLVIDASVDSQGAQAVYAEAHRQGKVLYLINTHEHHDHLAGNHLFACPIISSLPARESMVRAGARGLPTLAFSREMELHLSEPVRLRHFGGHSPGSATVYFPERKLLFTGDLIFAGRVPYMGEADFPAWLAALKTMEAWEVETVVPGHGPQGGKELLAQQSQWLEDYIRDVREWIGQSLAPQEMLDRVLARFQVVQHWQEMLVKSFQLIQEQFGPNPKLE